MTSIISKLNVQCKNVKNCIKVVNLLKKKVKRGRSEKDSKFTTFSEYISWLKQKAKGYLKLQIFKCSIDTFLKYVQQGMSICLHLAFFIKLLCPGFIFQPVVMDHNPFKSST